MNVGSVYDVHGKALPSPGANKLPPPPPDDGLSHYAPPPPPPKLGFDPDHTAPAGLRPAVIDTSASVHSLAPANHGALPPTPTSPAASVSSADARVKKSNPLIDLIETEKAYVDQLTGVIRKVASAWSRSNLPPPELDTMFRSLESVYKANRSLLARLKDIGTNPSNPKALGDLLMQWIEDLEAPYSNYCEKFCVGFDTWEPVQGNSRLPTMLASFSATNPPPLPSSGPQHPAEPPLWTMDDLFILPKGRIKYYRKLYGRLLKGTQPGRKDYKLLAGAAEKLDRLMSVIEGRASVRVGEPAPVEETEDEVVVDFRSQVGGLTLPPTPIRDAGGSALESQVSSPRGSSLSSGARFSGDTGSTSIDRGPLSIPITDLERRLSVDRCLDIFSMNPKQVRLQMLPPTLSFKRDVRLAADVFIRFTPKSTGMDVTHPAGRIFVLSDLFLIAERMTSEDRASSSEADMWLLYPPLAGKFLRIAEVDGQDNALQVHIMRKETLVLEFDSVSMRNRAIADFQDCIEFAAAMASSAKHPVPPMPSFNGIPKSPSAPLPSDRNGPPPSHSAPDLDNPSMNGSWSPPSKRSSSPSGGPLVTAFNERGQRSSDTLSRSSTNSGPLSEGMLKLVLSPEVQMQQGAQRVPALHDPLPGPRHPIRTSSQAQHFAAPVPLHIDHQPQSFAPGEIVTSPTHGPGQGMPGPGYFGPEQVMPGPGYGAPPQRGASAGPMGRSPPPNQGPPFGGQRPYMQGPPGGYMQAPNPPYASIPGRAPSDPSFQGGVRRSPSGGMGPPNPPYATSPGRAPSDPSFQGGIRQSPSGGMGPPNPPYASSPGRAPSDPSFQGGLRKSTSSRSLASQYDGRFSALSAPPMPPQAGYLPRNDSFTSMQAPQPPLLPSAQLSSRSISMVGSFDEPSPPGSPIEETRAPSGPVTSTISAQMKCKVFLKQQHAQWKSLGSAKLKLYRQEPTNVKQLVVEADDKRAAVLISTIVLSDGVERVGKTGVAIELSDQGARTGIVYMIQLRNEKSAGGLFDSLIAGSDRRQML